MTALDCFDKCRPGDTLVCKDGSAWFVWSTIGVRGKRVQICKDHHSFVSYDVASKWIVKIIKAK